MLTKVSRGTAQAFIGILSILIKHFLCAVALEIQKIPVAVLYFGYFPLTLSLL